jgi:hypothetical protein
MQPLRPEMMVEEPPPERLPTNWYRKLGTLLFIILSFEVGVFLVIFPWMQYWNHNSLARLAPWVGAMWESAYFRGALSGLGFINIFISLGEVLRLIPRKAPR